MPKNKKNLKIYAYQRRNSNVNEKNYDKKISNSEKLIHQKTMNNKSLQKLNSNQKISMNSYNPMNQSIIIKKAYKDDNSCCNIF